MNQAHLSTSSSDIAPSEPPRSPRLNIRAAVYIFIGIFVVIVGFEIGVWALFTMPAEARQPEGAFVRYFSYGYSTEAKLTRSVGQASQEPTNIVKAGWIQAEMYPPGNRWYEQKTRMIFYGMSFTNRIAAEVSQLDPTAAILTRAGPAAPLNHSYTMFYEDPWRNEADVIVVGVLSSSIPHMKSMSGMGFMPENPPPFAYPIYEFVEDELVVHDPVIRDLDTFVEAFRSKSELWQEHLAMLSMQDDYWDPLVYYAGISDRSALVRLMRRAWANRQVNVVANTAFSAEAGYDRDDNVLAAVPHMLENMRVQCSKNNQTFVVILLHALGEPGHLDEWLAAGLRAKGSTVLSTKDLFSSRDAMNFIGDGHYQNELDRLIAQTLLDAVHDNRDAIE